MVTQLSNDTTETDRSPAGGPARSGHAGPTRRAGPGGTRVGAGITAADALDPLLKALLGSDLPVRFEFWDGSGRGPVDGIGTIEVRSVDAVRRILWAPGELGVARAFVAGDLSVEGDLYQLLRVLHGASRGDLRSVGIRALPAAFEAARRLGVIGTPLPAPPEECRPAGRLHSPSRDAEVISHHYDVGNEFYRLVLGRP